MATDETQRVRVFLLGGFRVAIGEEIIPDDAWRLRRARHLVKLLALAPRHQLHREQVVDLLWPDLEPGAAANSLHQVLHAARQALAPGAPGAAGYLRLQDDILSLCPRHALWIDAEAFPAAASAAQRSDEPMAYRAALDLYAGDLLPEDRYEDWATDRREVLRRQHLDLLLELATLHEARQDYPPAIASLRQALAADPVQEGAHTGLMRLYVVTGQRQQALRQYQLLEDALRRELDVAPQPASTHLYQEILAGRFPDQGALGSGRHASPAHPAASSRSATAHTLPAQVNSFVGRVREMAEVKDLLAATRLLTLTGVGGCGKTRLAMQIAAELPLEFADGVWFVELAALGYPSLLAQAVATALGVTEQPGRSLARTLAAHLQPRSLLLLLDNCEHLIAACAELADLLVRTCPRLRILATSREPLRVPGEVVWRVASLGLPDPRRLPDPEDLVQIEAVRLFVDRARAVLPSFTLQEQNAAAVARVCCQLDGIPLAIELAAARMTALSIEQIAARLDDCFHLLTGGSRTALSRQQALRATLDWSHNLLAGPERTLFRRLAVFAGGFGLDAAEAVGSGDGLAAADVLDLLTRLVDKSLVVAEQQATEARYRLLEPIRQYARHHLEAAGEAAGVRARHRDWCLDLAEGARDALWTARHGASLARLEREHDNLRAALDCCLEAPSASPGLRLVGALWQFWLLRGHLAEGRRWLERMLARAPERSSARAATLLHVFALAGRLGDMPTANAAAEESLAIYREVADVPGIVRVACTVASSICMDGDYPRARALFAESLTLAREARFGAGAALATHALGMLAWWLGDYGRARALLEESLALLRQEPDQRDIASGFSIFGFVVTARRDDEPAPAWIEETVGVVREIATAAASGFVLANLGNLARVQGDYARARTRLDESVRHFRRIEDRSGLALVLNLRGNLARVEGEYEQASAFLAASLDLRREMDERLGIGRTLNSLGTLALARDDHVGAHALYEESLSLYRDLGDRPGMAGTLYVMGQLALSIGDNAAARTLYEEGAALEQEMHGRGRTLAYLLLNQGVAARRQGDAAAARSLFTSSLALFQQLGDQPNTAQLLRTLADLAGEEAVTLSQS